MLMLIEDSKWLLEYAKRWGDKTGLKDSPANKHKHNLNPFWLGSPIKINHSVCRPPKENSWLREWPWHIE